jgi:hypothetical protein
MIAPRVPHEIEIFKELEEQGFERTGTTTKTGEFWRHKPTGRHLQVPFSIQGYFPDWLCWQFKAQAAEIATAPAPKQLRLIKGGKRDAAK